MANPAPFVWTPSGDRVITIFGQAKSSPTLNQGAVLPLRWPDTPAESTFDYGIDCTELLTGGDTIEAAAVEAGLLQLVAQVVNGPVLTVWLSGLVTGVDNPVGITVSTAMGRVVNRIVRLMAI